MKFKKIICWPPLLAGVGATVTIGILAYITYQTELGLWLLASFGATTVIVFGYHFFQNLIEREFFFLHNFFLVHKNFFLWSTIFVVFIALVKLFLKEMFLTNIIFVLFFSEELLLNFHPTQYSVS